MKSEDLVVRAAMDEVIIQTVLTTGAASAAASKIILATTNTICDQLSRAESIDELIDTIRKLREAAKKD